MEIIPSTFLQYIPLSVELYIISCYPLLYTHLNVLDLLHSSALSVFLCLCSKYWYSFFGHMKGREENVMQQRSAEKQRYTEVRERKWGREKEKGER